MVAAKEMAALLPEVLFPLAGEVLVGIPLCRGAAGQDAGLHAGPIAGPWLAHCWPMLGSPSLDGDYSPRAAYYLPTDSYVSANLLSSRTIDNTIFRNYTVLVNTHGATDHTGSHFISIT